jgi:tRNA-dihydrouridine synthase B
MATERDWTWSCVALENEDIRELNERVAVGTAETEMHEIKPFKIRDVEINPPLILSPMAGVTDVSFRRLLKRRGGVGLTVSEFISVEGLTRSNPKSKRQMRFYPEERPFAAKIFGGQPERMRMAAEMAEEVGADILDINCGCPAPKVVKHGGGSGLLKDH